MAESTIAQSPAIIDDAKVSRRVMKDFGGAEAGADAGAGTRSGVEGADAGAGAVVVARVAAASVLFAAYHYLGNETFQLRSFVFRTIAGVYFGIIFLVRGFGVTAGSHACYDIFATSLRIFAH